MKRVISYLIVFAMLIGLLVPAGNIDAATKLKLAKKKVTVRVNESVKVKYTSAKKPKVTSKNKKIAKAKVKGRKIVITGVKKGKTSVTVKASGKSAVIKVIVKKAKNSSATATPAPTTDPKIIEEALKKMSAESVAINKFSCNTFKGIKTADGNTFASPFSLYIALAMVVNGADGNTRTELLSALGISDLSTFNNKVKNILKGSSDEKVVLNIANATWLNNNFEMSPNIENDFIKPVKECYNAEVKKDVKLSSPEFVAEINRWAEEKTNGMIKKVLNEPLSDAAAVVLANAVYFLGTWKYPFEERATADKEFNGLKGKKTISMMNRSNVYGKYFKNDKFVGASIPYGNGNYAMDILMSADTGTTAGKVWDGLTVDEQISALTNLSLSENSKKIDLLSLPKFEMDGDFNDELIRTLNNMGVKDAFDDTKADFTKIGKQLFISKVKQKTKLKVNEKGTEAAAVTTIVMDVASAPATPVERIEFIVDRPFIFTIRDTVSGMILFIGEVNDL